MRAGSSFNYGHKDNNIFSYSHHFVTILTLAHFAFQLCFSLLGRIQSIQLAVLHR